MSDLSFLPPSTFAGLVGTYRLLLENNPGKAIRLSPDSAALLVDGRVAWALLDESGRIDRSSLVELDEPATGAGAHSDNCGPTPEFIPIGE